MTEAEAKEKEIRRKVISEMHFRFLSTGVIADSQDRAHYCRKIESKEVKE